MNATETVQEIVRLIDNLKPFAKGSYVLVLNNKKLEIISERRLIPDDMPIAYFTSTDINIGMTSKGWDRIETSLRHLIKEGLL